MAAIFCTVFDKNYLHQGVTLYRSLEKAVPDFKLYCLALDDISVQTLKKLNFKYLIPLSLEEMNQNWVNEIRPLTSYGQFCWSMQPVVCHAVFGRGESHVAYVEADSYFFSSPISLMQEIGEHAACVAPHWYSSDYVKYENTSGVYCTHFNFFKNNPEGRECLEYWRQQNFQYRKEKPLIFPGQHGLNEWPTKFKQVCELKHRGAGVAPWNIQQYTLSKTRNGIPTVNGNFVIFYHYHQLSRYVDGSFDLGNYPLTIEAVETFYKPYIQSIMESEKIVSSVDPSFTYRREITPPPSIISALLSGDINQMKKSTQPIRRKLSGTYNVFPLQYFRSSRE